MKSRNNLAILAVLAALLVAAVLWFLLWPVISPDQTAEQAPSEAQAPAPPAVDEKAAGKAEETSKPAKEEASESDRPSFDVVRIEPTGEGVVAGRAPPGWSVRVESRGMTVAEAIADDQGEWTAILEKPLAAGAHDLSLTAISPEGSEERSSAQTVAAEIAAPPAGKVASADDAPATSEEKDGETPEPATADASPPAADKAEETPATAEEKAGETPEPVTETADASPPTADKEEETSKPVEEEAAAEPARPSFGVVRIEPTGEGVLSGRAAPGWTVSVESHGVNVAEAVADDRGEWRAALTKPLAFGAHTLWLTAKSPDGSQQRSAVQTVTAEVVTPPTKKADLPEDAPSLPPAAQTGVGAASAVMPTDTAIPAAPKPTVTPGRPATSDAPALPQTAALEEERATPPAQLSPQDRPGNYTILPGDTLWDIAQRYLGAGWRYKQIYRDNRKIIRNPNRIYPEQRMSIPEPPGEAN